MSVLAPPLRLHVLSCTPPALAMRIERRPGQFTGMSHDGAIVLVRNIGNTACAMPPVPRLTMLDATGATIATNGAAGSRLLQSGPVRLPLVLASGQAAAAKLRWVSANVFGGPAFRATAVTLALTIGGGIVKAPLPAAAIWGLAGGEITFTAERFQILPSGRIPPNASPER